MFCHWTILDYEIIYIACIQMSLKLRILTDTQKSASYPDLHIEIKFGEKLITKLYDKHDDFSNSQLPVYQ